MNQGEPIKTVIRYSDNMVMVFDGRGEQIPQYQGQYPAVKENILRDAPTEALFVHGFTAAGELRPVPKSRW